MEGDQTLSRESTDHDKWWTFTDDEYDGHENLNLKDKYKIPTELSMSVPEMSMHMQTQSLTPMHTSNSMPTMPNMPMLNLSPTAAGTVGMHMSEEEWLNYLWLSGSECTNSVIQNCQENNHFNTVCTKR